jgi:hypothetical protein
MGLERRGRADQGQPGANPEGEEPRAGPRPEVKPFEIGKRLIYEAWEKVRANKTSDSLLIVVCRYVDGTGEGAQDRRCYPNVEPGGPRGR